MLYSTYIMYKYDNDISLSYIMYGYVHTNNNVARIEFCYNENKVNYA